MAKELLPKNLLHEAELARHLSFAPGADEVELSSNYILSHVLFSLYDSGFYEYVRQHPHFTRAQIVADLHYDAMTFDWLIYALIGRGLVRDEAGELSLTERGQSFTNTITRGLLNLYAGGYNGLLSNLGPLLRGEVTLDDPRLDRSARHAAAGTEDLTCVRVVPAVIDLLKEKGVEGILDLGCGTGGFLIQWAQLTNGWGAGVDMSAGALQAARENAIRFGMQDRLSFYLGEVGREALPISPEVVSRVGALTAMFILHEFGRGGDAAIVRVLRALAAQFAGKLLIALEMPPVNLADLNGRPPPSLDALDYHFIHPLSRQGEPRPKAVWEGLYEQAGMKLLNVRRPKNSPVLVHVVQM
ncbi:MAG TPA: methyltransferase domain-containing protein [Polyangia bacterium]|jgi:SAM-dependent methyltransferase|nr:methyltransferase domain-containing protein [Polyangia bacterium]